MSPELSSSRSSVRALKRRSLPAASTMTVVVIEDEPKIGKPLRDSLREDGHTIHLCAQRERLVDHIARLQPDAIVVNLNLNVREARELILKIRTRFAYVYLIVYTAWNAQIVRAELRPDLVLSPLPPFWLASQLRCWARHV